MINQKFKIVFQISQPAKIPQKWFSAQNGPLDVRFQMRLNPNRVGFSIFGKMTESGVGSMQGICPSLCVLRQ